MKFSKQIIEERLDKSMRKRHRNQWFHMFAENAGEALRIYALRNTRENACNSTEQLFTRILWRYQIRDGWHHGGEKYRIERGRRQKILIETFCIFAS